MGLRETFRKAAQTGIAAAGDVAVSTNYESLASTTYNASSGVNAVTFATVGGVSVIFDVFELKQSDGTPVVSEDRKALIAAKDISTVTPDADDRIVVAGVAWRVVSASIDPADALWEIRVRKS
tara:strand:- start:178 stop:546 length:369 start_codon:yes stop_codon:yes gene_type:complete